MTPRHPSRPVRSGFTLVELLTVIGIIALLIGILVPSLQRARDQAKRAVIMGTLKSVGGNLEMFHNDFGQYPDSSRRPDPVKGWPSPPGDSASELSGAHWLARAMMGHDFQGMDAAGRVMELGSGIYTYDEFRPDTSPPGRYSQRKDPYLEGGDKVWLADDSTKFNRGSFTPTHRPVLIDGYNYPIIYYRANSKSKRPFSLNAGPGQAEQLGIYNHRDNALITGGGSGGNGWEFAAGSGNHPLGTPGNMNNYSDIDEEGRFINYMHDDSTHQGTGGIVIRPYNPESFILISAGKDGLFGTKDDINNFKGGL